MPNTGAQFCRRLRASDVESSIELDGIEIDDLAAGGLGETDSNLRLACAGRPSDHNDAH
jgi:hypothetical protein